MAKKQATHKENGKTVSGAAPEVAEIKTSHASEDSLSQLRKDFEAFKAKVRTKVSNL